MLPDERRKTLGYVRLDIICFIVVSCNKWELGAVWFEKIPHDPILCMGAACVNPYLRRDDFKACIVFVIIIS